MEEGETHFWLLPREVTALSVVACSISILALSGAIWRAISAEWPSNHNFTLRTRIELNSASEEDLTLLPGIGPFRAKKIIAYHRSLNGGFESVDELMNVPGLPASVVDRIRDEIKVE